MQKKQDGWNMNFTSSNNKYLQVIFSTHVFIQYVPATFHQVYQIGEFHSSTMYAFSTVVLPKQFAAPVWLYPIQS